MGEAPEECHNISAVVLTIVALIGKKYQFLLVDLTGKGKFQMLPLGFSFHVSADWRDNMQILRFFKLELLLMPVAHSRVGGIYSDCINKTTEPARDQT